MGTVPFISHRLILEGLVFSQAASQMPSPLLSGEVSTSATPQSFSAARRARLSAGQISALL